jgi:hypothetical protein
MKVQSSVGTVHKPWMSACATVVTALLCNACCWLPPLLIAMTGTGAGFLAALDPYKPYLIAFTAVQLSVGLFLVYRKPKHPHTCAVHRDPEAHRRMNIRIMWVVVAFVVVLNAWDLSHPHHHGLATAAAVATK